MSKNRVYSTKPGDRSKGRASTGMYAQQKFVIDQQLKESHGMNLIPRGTITSMTFGGTTFELLNTATLAELEKAFKKQDYRVQLCTDALRYQSKTVNELTSKVQELQAKLDVIEAAVENLRIFGLYGNQSNF